MFGQHLFFRWVVGTLTFGSISGVCRMARPQSLIACGDGEVVRSGIRFSLSPDEAIGNVRRNFNALANEVPLP